MRDVFGSHTTRRRRSPRDRWWNAVPAVVLALALLLLAGCAGTVSLGDGDSGKTVTAHPGDEVVMSLSENPSTGYTWDIEKNDDALLPLAKSEFNGPAFGPPGSGGTRTLTFNAKQPGTVDLQLRCWRSWEGDKSIVGRYNV